MFILSYQPTESEETMFILEHQLPISTTSATWIGDDCLLTGNGQKLEYIINGQVCALAAVLDKPLKIVGYLEAESLVVCTDKNATIVTYNLPTTVVAFQGFILDKQLNKAEQLLSTIPVTYHDRLSRFLSSHEMYDMALNIAKDSKLKFDLALQTNQLDLAKKIAEEANERGKWRHLSKAAIKHGNLQLAQYAAMKAFDTPTSLLLQACTGINDNLAKLAEDIKQPQVSLASLMLSRSYDSAWQLIMKSGKFAEAAFFARTYCPHHIDESVQAWKTNGHKVTQLMCDLGMGGFDPRVVAKAQTVPSSTETGKDERRRASSIDSTHALSSFTTYTSNTQASNEKGSSLIDDNTSLEVNTTGTGSIRADDLDDLFGGMRLGSVDQKVKGSTSSTVDQVLFPHPEEEPLEDVNMVEEFQSKDIELFDEINNDAIADARTKEKAFLDPNHGKHNNENETDEEEELVKAMELGERSS